MAASTLNRTTQSVHVGAAVPSGVLSVGRAERLARTAAWYAWLFVRRYWAVVVVAVAAIAVLAAQPWIYRPPEVGAIRADALWYHSWTRALLDGQLSWCDYYRSMDWPDNAPIGAAGRCPVAYPPGLAFIRFPVMVFFTAANGGALRSGAEDSVALLLAVVAAVIAVTAIVATARRLGVPWTIANVAALAVVFGTGMFNYGTLDGAMPHIWIAAFVAVLALMTVQIPGLVASSGRTVPASIGWVGSLAWFGVPWLLLLLRQTSLVVIVCVLGCASLYAWRRHGVQQAVALLRRPFVLAAAGILAAVTGQIIYNSWAYGGFAVSSYGEARFQFERFNQPAVLFSLRRGLVTGYPVVIVAFAAAALARRWWLLAAASVPTLLLALIYGSWPWWDLGGGFGHRGFVDVAPLWGVALAVGLAAASRRLRVVLYVGTALCVTATLGLLTAYWSGDAGLYGFTNAEWVRFAVGGESFPVRAWHGFGR